MNIYLITNSNPAIPKDNINILNIDNIISSDFSTYKIPSESIVLLNNIEFHENFILKEFIINLINNNIHFVNLTEGKMFPEDVDFITNIMKKSDSISKIVLEASINQLYFYFLKKAIKDSYEFIIKDSNLHNKENNEMLSLEGILKKYAIKNIMFIENNNGSNYPNSLEKIYKENETASVCILNNKEVDTTKVNIVVDNNTILGVFKKKNKVNKFLAWAPGADSIITHPVTDGYIDLAKYFLNKYTLLYKSSFIKLKKYSETEELLSLLIAENPDRRNTIENINIKTDYDSLYSLGTMIVNGSFIWWTGLINEDKFISKSPDSVLIENFLNLFLKNFNSVPEGQIYNILPDEIIEKVIDDLNGFKVLSTNVKFDLTSVVKNGFTVEDKDKVVLSNKMAFDLLDYLI